VQTQVVLVFEDAGEEYIGKGTSTDTVDATLLAYINAVNKHLLLGDQKSIVDKSEEYQ
jgi:hypothetical protein